MSATVQRSSKHKSRPRPTKKAIGKTKTQVLPSWLETPEPFTLDQELEPFGSWAGDAVWVPPKDSSDELAKTMLANHGAFASKDRCWNTVVEQHRKKFTQVREINMRQASIRLPQGKLFVEVTERENFDKIEDKIPACVQTRLDEFLAGPGKAPGVKVYYLKPLCVEVGDDLIFTGREDIDSAISQIQREVFSAYRRMYIPRRAAMHSIAAADAALYVPKQVARFLVERRKKAVDAYHAKLEFKRRKIAMKAANIHRKLRTDGCSFDDMLVLTNPLQREDVIEQYGIEKELSRAKRDRLLKIAGYTAAGSIPWFMAISIGLSYMSAAAVSVAPPLMVCDPAFVAEMPGSKGVVLKIGHFDEVAGVTHVEI